MLNAFKDGMIGGLIAGVGCVVVFGMLGFISEKIGK